MTGLCEGTNEPPGSLKTPFMGCSATDISKEVSLEVNPEKTKYMIMSRDQSIIRNGNIKIGNLSFEKVEKFKYLGATVTKYINDTREEIKRRINIGNTCYYSVDKLLSASLIYGI
ncbi:hypothetical protein ANN_05332 [Periplaneta americana]|uniref:Uncharacterized protein n=1 Tax=Periplaneta americana TaxID=6978 RepID=A0ABQ8TCY6_PERAM|nr:hypothetical protein ANN_05332 [Periplaneta americana]